LSRLHLALLTYHLSRPALDDFIAKYRLLKDDRDVLTEVAQLQPRLERLAENGIRPSEIVALLDDFGSEARFLVRVASDSWLVQQRLDIYQRRLRHIRPLLDGDDLRALGIPAGRIYREILEALRAGRVDGRLSSRADEEALARQMAAVVLKS
jgi:tRNA nucleotidyltransferase (CCA-adding enzyme)